MTATPPTPGVLHGLKVLDLSDAKAFFCGKTFGMLGADVYKIEPPGGDVERGYGPFNAAGESLYWKAFNTDKRSVVLDITTPDGAETLRRMVAQCDFLIESFLPGHMERLGLGYQALKAINPTLVMVSITGFGQTGPYAHYRATELIAVATGGVLHNTGDPDRAPVKEGLESTYLHASLAGAVGALMAYYHILDTGADGQQIDVSLQETCASRMTSSILAWQFDQLTLHRQGDKSQLGPTATTWFWPCKDGHLFWHMLGGLHGAPANKALTAWIDEYDPDNALHEVEDWRKFDKAGISQEQWDRFEAAIRPHFMRFTKAEIAHESQKRGVNACVSANPLEVLESEQLGGRGYWATLGDQGVRYPGYLYKSTGVPHASSRPAPALGADTQAVLDALIGTTAMTETTHA